MENTTKDQITSTCQISLDNLGFHKPIVIKEENQSSHYYEVKASTILQINQKTIGIYGSTQIKIDDNIEILGHCNDLSFLSPQTVEETVSTHDNSQAEIDYIIEMSGDCFGFYCLNI